MPKCMWNIDGSFEIEIIMENHDKSEQCDNRKVNVGCLSLILSKTQQKDFFVREGRHAQLY